LQCTIVAGEIFFLSVQTRANAACTLARSNKKPARRPVFYQV
jgi:hypothetical protein